MYVDNYHELESKLKELNGLKIVNKPAADEFGKFLNRQFYTCLFDNQYICVDEDKDSVTVKIYIRLSPFTKQRAEETIIITGERDFLTVDDMENIKLIISTMKQYKLPLPNSKIQQIYGDTGLHPLSGYFMQLSKRFLESLGDNENYILNELQYIENTVTTVSDKFLIFHGRDERQFTYNLAKMHVIHEGK